MRPPESIWHSPTKCREWVDDHMPGKKTGGGELTFDADFEIEKA